MVLNEYAMFDGRKNFTTCPSTKSTHTPITRSKELTQLPNTNSVIPPNWYGRK